MKALLKKLFNQEILTEQEAFAALTDIAQGKYSEAELASLLTVYNMRAITPAEFKGFRDAMLALSIPTKLHTTNAIDIVGTGGDGKDTFNISTLTCFIVVGAGYKVIKHGNYSASSVSGSSHMLEYFGYQFSNQSKKLNRDLDRAGLCFLHAPLFHPAMKSVAPVRKKLQVKTFFNILGPLVNPAQPNFQLYGTYNYKTAKLYQGVLEKAEQKNFSIVNSKDGYDEISLTDSSYLLRHKNESLINASDFGYKTLSPQDIKGGKNIEENAQIFLDILSGKGTPAQTKVVLANSAIAIQCMKPNFSREHCLSLATKSLESKEAFTVFKKLTNS